MNSPLMQKLWGVSEDATIEPGNNDSFTITVRGIDVYDIDAGKIESLQ